MFKINKIIKILVFLILLGILLTGYENSKYLFTSKDANLIEEDWIYNDEPIRLGHQLSLEKNIPYKIETTLPKDVLGKYILLRSSLSSVNVTIDEVVIYNEAFSENKMLPIASLWHIIKLPNKGDILTITYKSPYKSMNGILNDVVYGNRSDLLFYILEIYGKPFILDLLIMFLGLLMILLSIAHPKGVNSTIWYIGLFSVMVSFWLIAESRMIQFFTGNQLIIGSLAYISLAIIPIPLIHYIKSFASISNQKIYNLFLKITWTNLGFMVFMQIFNIKDFYETVIVTHSIMTIFIIAILIMLYFEIRRKNNPIAKHFVISLVILFAFIMIGIFSFYNHTSENLTFFIRFGLLCFILMLSLNSFKELIGLLKKSYKSEFYRQLAYQDQLTQGPNRTAFEKDLDEIFHDKERCKHLRLVILDMNQLKKINDDYGHVIGDEAIKKAYDIINFHFSKLGKTYRIGGDEFACIISDDINDDYDNFHLSFIDYVSKENDNLPYPFGIALGSVKYDPSLDLAMNNFMHRADINMYKSKKKLSLEAIK